MTDIQISEEDHPPIELISEFHKIGLCIVKIGSFVMIDSATRTEITEEENDEIMKFINEKYKIGDEIKL